VSCSCKYKTKVLISKTGFFWVLRGRICSILSCFWHSLVASRIPWLIQGHHPSLHSLCTCLFPKFPFTEVSVILDKIPPYELIISVIIFFLVDLGFELRALHLQSRHSTTWATPGGVTPFCCGYFEDGISWTICLGWPWTLILPISASQVARITGMGPWHLALCNHFNSTWLPL
jgi:hypothetical protein